MAPKRKLIDDSAAQVETSSSTRPTRSSARISGTQNATTETNQKSTDKGSARTTSLKAPQNVDDADSDAVHVAKRPKTTKSAAASKAKATSKTPKKVGKKGDLNDDVPTSSKPISSKEISIPEVSNPLSTVETQAAPGTNPSPSSKKAEKGATYTPQHALELFSIYTEKDDKTVIATEGFERLCTDAKIPFDGALPLILAWQMGAKEMGRITKDEWMKGTNSLRISSLSSLSLAVTELEDLLIRGRAPLKSTGKKEDYDRSAYDTYARDVRAGFHKLYLFSYVLAKPEQSKNMDMEISAALWSVLLAPKYPIMTEVLHFIDNNLETYKATNKDLWNMMFEFCHTVNPNLQDYEADGAWPTLLDDFVSSKKSETAANSSDS